MLIHSVGIQPGVNFNSGKLFGSSWAATAINPAHETRSSSKTTFVHPTFGSTGIKVCAHTMAKSGLLKNKNQASGVKVEMLGIPYTRMARKEVISSAGTFQPSEFLMVSGIGPCSTLQKSNVPVIKDLPGVGQNIYDHVMLGTTTVVNVTAATTSVSNRGAAAEAPLQYVSGLEPLTAPGFGVLGWEKLPESSHSCLSNAILEARATLPDDWLQVGSLEPGGVLGSWKSALDQFVNGKYGAVGAAIVASFSRGNVTIKSAGSEVPPVINPNLLSHPQTSKSLWNSSDVVISEECLPGPSVSTDRRGHCLCSICCYDRLASGVEGLRVVDAMTFPFLPPGHPQPTC